jgi:hypothetical protein
MRNIGEQDMVGDPGNLMAVVARDRSALGSDLKAVAAFRKIIENA